MKAKSDKKEDIFYKERLKIVKRNATLDETSRVILNVDTKSDLEFIKKHNLNIKY